jgi:hypothetical protein
VKQKENEPPYPYGKKMEGDAVCKSHKEEREMLIRSIGDEHLSLPFVSFAYVHTFLEI